MNFLRKIMFVIGILIIFSTTLNAQVFTEDFESGIPNTWAIFDNGVGTTNSWEPIAFGTGNTIAQILYDCTVASDAEDWLVTPQITPTATDNFLRFFQADPDIADYGSIMTIRISTMSQTNPADFTTIYTQGESVLTPSLKPHQIDLSTYIGQPIYIAFVMTQNCGDRWIIDDVEVRSECTIDLSVTQNEFTLTANEASSGTTYEWIACSGAPISGETNQSFTATVDGHYAVQITTGNGCSQMSGCYYLAPLSIPDNEFSKELNLYPNPTHGNFSLDLGNTYVSTAVTLTDLTGRVLKKYTHSNEQKLNLKTDQPAGVYLLIVASEDKKAVLKLVKE